MASVIIIGNGLSSESLTEALASVSNQQGVEVILANNKPLNAANGIKFVSTEGSAPTAALQKAIQAATQENILIIDAGAKLQRGSLQNALQSIDNNAAVTWFPIDTGDSTIELIETSSEGIFKTITSEETLPAAALAVRKNCEILKSLVETSSTRELLAQILIGAITANETAARASATITADKKNSRFSNQELASCLRTLVNNSNIEELFSQHDWITHEKESAAASYHALAALFIKLGDNAAALECLRLSDQLEESPRSLALKGLISLSAGEILGAVANMVSSLQQYEIRKKENDKHYARFVPSNLELIKENLNQGLSALNQRDNNRALGHFAKAVFGFDSFYHELGVDRVAIN